MGEIDLMWIGVGKILLTLICAILYSLGGRDNVPKAIRRFVAPGVLTAGLIGFSFISSSFSFLLLLVYPILVLAYCQGYGSDEPIVKFLKRMWCALFISLCGIPVVLITGSWLLFAMQAWLAFMTSTILGVWNPLTASQEELVIGFLTIVLVPFML